MRHPLHRLLQGWVSLIEVYQTVVSQIPLLYTESVRPKSQFLQISRLLGLILHNWAGLISCPTVLSSAVASQNPCVSLYRTSWISGGDSWCNKVVSRVSFIFV